MSEVRYSRSLYLPGPVPPSTHLGITLQRHALVSGLRYALYHLGFPLPDRAPVKVVQLRLYLDREALDDHLCDHAGSSELVGALCDPRGDQPSNDQTGELAAAAMFHRFRLSMVRRRRPRPMAEAADGDTAWRLFRTGVTDWLGLLNDAFLTEILSSRSRRRRRGERKTVAATLPREAWSFRKGRDCRLEALGPADLYMPAWNLDRPCRLLARDMVAGEKVPPRDLQRGLFRETYREMLTQLRAPYLALGETAYERGVLDHPDDAFFIPFDLAGDLTGTRRPAWLDEAVESNRREHESYLTAAPPPDQLSSGNPVVSGLRRPPEQVWTSLLPIL